MSQNRTDRNAPNGISARKLRLEHRGSFASRRLGTSPNGRPGTSSRCAYQYRALRTAVEERLANVLPRRRARPRVREPLIPRFIHEHRDRLGDSSHTTRAGSTLWAGRVGKVHMRHDASERSNLMSLRNVPRRRRRNMLASPGSVCLQHRCSSARRTQPSVRDPLRFGISLSEGSVRGTRVVEPPVRQRNL